MNLITYLINKKKETSTKKGGINKKRGHTLKEKKKIKQPHL